MKSGKASERYKHGSLHLLAASRKNIIIADGLLQRHKTGSLHRVQKMEVGKTIATSKYGQITMVHR